MFRTVDSLPDWVAGWLATNSFTQLKIPKTRCGQQTANGLNFSGKIYYLLKE